MMLLLQAMRNMMMRRGKNGKRTKMDRCTWLRKLSDPVEKENLVGLRTALKDSVILLELSER